MSLVRSTSLKTFLTGAGAGAAATLPMSGVLLASQRLGFLGKLPPEKITEAALDTAHVPRDESTEDALSTLAHFGYGAGCGALFAAVARRGWTPLRSTLAGALFGTAVWFVSYEGWIPSVGILPPAHRDDRGRQGTMLLAHWVFGGVLGALLSSPRATRR